MYSEETKTRLWNKIDKSSGPDGCWCWTGHLDKDGYGRIVTYYNGKRLSCLPHRVVWEVINNNRIPFGTCICHSCDNPSCCNPSHLWAGTQKENIKDRDKKGRHGCATIQGSVVSGIRCLKIFGKYRNRDLCKMFGFSRSHISNILQYKKWKNL